KPVEEPKAWNLVDWLSREVGLGSLRFPRWALLLPAAVFLAICVIGLVVSPRSEETQVTAAVLPEPSGAPAQAVATNSALPEPNRLAQLISRAEFGDQSALSELRDIAPEKREREVWLVIAQGLAKAGLVAEAVKELDGAVHAKADLKNDERLTAVVREVASSDNSPAALEALTLAATKLESRGVDILFSVWSETKLRTPATALAERYLGDKAVLKNASKAVHIALDLRKDDLDCEQAK